MRPVEFTQEEIITAGEALLVAGRNITGFALRQKVGGGHPARLKQVWDEHLASKNTAEVEPVAELPVEVAEEVAAVTKSLTERLASLAVELNDKAVKAAERRVAEVLRTAGEQREQAERELVDAAQAVDELETKLEESGSKIVSLEEQLRDSQAQRQAQAVEIAQLRERISATEQSARAAQESHRRELEQADSKTRSIAAELEVTRREESEKKEVLRDELAQLKERLATAEKEGKKVEALQAELIEQKNKVATLTQSLADTQVRADQEVSRLSELLNESKLAFDTARKESVEAREAAAKSAGQLEALQSQNATLLEAVRQSGLSRKSKGPDKQS